MDVQCKLPGQTLHLPLAHPSWRTAPGSVEALLNRPQQMVYSWTAQLMSRPADGDWHWQHLKALSSAEPRLQWLGTSDRWGLPTPGAKSLARVPHVRPSTLHAL